eukprot:PhM_4_TR13313/c1_g2_i2/m.21067
MSPFVDIFLSPAVPRKFTSSPFTSCAIWMCWVLLLTPVPTAGLGPQGVFVLYVSHDLAHHAGGYAPPNMMLMYLSDGLPARVAYFSPFPGPYAPCNRSAYFVQVGSNDVARFAVIRWKQQTEVKAKNEQYEHTILSTQHRRYEQSEQRHTAAYAHRTSRIDSIGVALDLAPYEVMNNTWYTLTTPSNSSEPEPIGSGIYVLRRGTGLTRELESESGCPGAPPEHPIAICSGNGACNATTYECECTPGYFGPACESSTQCQMQAGVALHPNAKFDGQVTTIAGVLGAAACCAYTSSLREPTIAAHNALTFTCTIYRPYVPDQMTWASTNDTSQAVIVSNYVSPTPTASPPSSPTPTRASSWKDDVFNAAVMAAFVIVGVQVALLVIACVSLYYRAKFGGSGGAGGVRGVRGNGHYGLSPLFRTPNARASPPHSDGLLSTSPYMKKYRIKRKLNKGARGGAYVVERRRDNAVFVMKIVTGTCVEELWSEYSAVREVQGHPNIIKVYDTYFSWGGGSNNNNNNNYANVGHNSNSPTIGGSSFPRLNTFSPESIRTVDGPPGTPHHGPASPTDPLACSFEGTTMRRQFMSIVMPYYQRGTLLDRVNTNKPIPYRTVLSYAHQLCDALSFIHRRNLIHADVKSSNVLVSDNMQTVYLSDLGLATSSADAGGCGELRGTLGYMSPEQARGILTPAADVWGLGVVILDMLRAGVTTPSPTNDGGGDAFYPLADDGTTPQQQQTSSSTSVFLDTQVRSLTAVPFMVRCTSESKHDAMLRRSFERTTPSAFLERVLLPCLRVSVEDRVTSYALLSELKKLVAEL